MRSAIQLCIVRKHHDVAPDRIREVVHIDNKEHRAQNGALRDTAHDRELDRAGPADHHSLTATSEKRLDPPEQWASNSKTVQFLDQSLVPNRVESFLKVKVSHINRFPILYQLSPVLQCQEKLC